MALIADEVIDKIDTIELMHLTQMMQLIIYDLSKRIYVYHFSIIIHGKPSISLWNHFHVNVYKASQTFDLHFLCNFR